MANERDQDQFNDSNDRETGNTDGSRNEFGQQDQKQPAGAGSQQGNKDQDGQDGRMSGQPIGGNDSRTGTGTPLSQGFNAAGGSGSIGASGEIGSDGGRSATGQAQSGSDTLASSGDDSDQQSKDDGFVGSKGENSGEYLQEGEKQDFAEQGRGAPDKKDGEPGSGGRF